ncbi:MAG: MqnA/MqnD/SBP family protein, partial [Candidatus Hydrogenedentota bacterium]
KTKFGVAPLLADHASDAFARLYIGNDALESNQSNASCSEIIDLSEWWYRESDLPFVFARWVVRSSLTDDAKETIEAWLEESVQAAATPEGKRQMALNNKTAFGSMSEAVEYYQRIHFHLGDQELSGLSQFKMAIKESSECISIA